MADDTPASEKEHEPTQQKLDEVRKKGEIAKSNDLTTAAGFLGALLSAYVMGGQPIADFVRAMSTAFRITVSSDVSDMGHLGARIILGVLSEALLFLCAFAALPTLLVIGCIMVQRAFVFAPDKLKPKMSRISVLSNAKNKYGRNGLFEFFKSALKLICVSCALGAFSVARLPEMMNLQRATIPAMVVEIGRLTTGFLVVVVAILAVIGAIDFMWQSAEHLRKNRMSRQDMKDEQKKAEGDPEMKGKRRQRAQEIAMNKMLADVPGADVVVVNPTHYAVALKWTRLRGEAPVCVAKGKDEIALKIKAIAKESNVPIRHDPPTARALHAMVKVGEEIHMDHYRAVAAAIRFADAMKQKPRRGL